MSHAASMIFNVSLLILHVLLRGIVQIFLASCVIQYFQSKVTFKRLFLGGHDNKLVCHTSPNRFSVFASNMWKHIILSPQPDMASICWMAKLMIMSSIIVSSLAWSFKPDCTFTSTIFAKGWTNLSKCSQQRHNTLCNSARGTSGDFGHSSLSISLCVMPALATMSLMPVGNSRSGRIIISHTFLVRYGMLDRKGMCCRPLDAWCKAFRSNRKREPTY
jgi:hypothetical protein